jgi:D-beta-D-heptose 7-phosphate kinase/D-beta-D-heptose 1-phosphate adenosyltransferase
MSASKRILVIGDTCEDRFVSVDANRLSPEVPVAVVSPYSTTSNPGMAGNVAANIQSLAPEWTVVTRFPDKPSIKTRYVDRKTNHHFIRIDDDVHPEPLDGIDWLSSIRMCPNAIVLSDYAKGYLTRDNMERVARFCATNRLPVFADTKALLGSWSNLITFVKINALEFDNQIKAGISPWKECQHLIVTRGGAGIDLYAQDGSIAHHVDAVGGEVVDLAGAGDSTLAALTVGYMETGDIKQAMSFAARVAGIAVSKRGVVAVKREEVK